MDVLRGYVDDGHEPGDGVLPGRSIHVLAGPFENYAQLGFTCLSLGHLRNLNGVAQTDHRR